MSFLRRFLGPTDIGSRLKRLICFGIASSLVLLTIGLYQFRSGFKSDIPSVVTDKEWEFARQAFQRQYNRAPDRIDRLSWLAEWYRLRKHLAPAVACFSEVPTSHPIYGRMARYQQGLTLLEMHQAQNAEQQFRELIAKEEANPSIPREDLIDARQRLRHILEVELRFEERHELLKPVVARGEADHFEVIVSCFPSHLRWNGPDAVQWLNEFLAADPSNRTLRIAKGRYLTGQGELQEAREVLEKVVLEEPQNMRAKAALIACLRESDAPEEVSRMMRSLPPQSVQDSWLLLYQRGIYALENGQGDEAMAAYEQVLQSDRTANQAWQGVANSARLTGDEQKRSHAIFMSKGLGRIQNHLGKGMKRTSDPNSFLDVADLCAEIDLLHEGRVFTEYARKLAPNDSRVQATLKFLESRQSKHQVIEENAGKPVPDSSQDSSKPGAN